MVDDQFSVFGLRMVKDVIARHYGKVLRIFSKHNCLDAHPRRNMYLFFLLLFLDFIQAEGLSELQILASECPIF